MLRLFALSSDVPPRPNLADIQVDLPEMDLAETKKMGEILRGLRSAAAQLYTYGLNCDDIAQDLAGMFKTGLLIDIMVIEVTSGPLMHILIRRPAYSAAAPALSEFKQRRRRRGEGP